MSTTSNRRIASIDILRGITLFMMILCANIGWHSDLPGWMFHCQTPPPTYAFNPDNVGITWVDLVFPIFLFTMGAAFPFALRKKMENGTSTFTLTAGLFRRWFTLSIFAIVLGNAYELSGATVAEWIKNIFRLIIWGVMFMSLVRLDNKPWGKHINNIGLILMIALAVVKVDYFGVPLNRWAADIIIMILANVAFWGGLIWMLTKDSIRLRWLFIAFVAVLKGLSSYTPDVLSWIPDFSAIGWFFRWEYLQYLVIALIGSVIGDMLLNHSRSGHKIEIESRHIIAGFIAIMAVLVQLWGLYVRAVLADLIISAVLGAGFIALTFRQRNIMTDVGYIGFALLLIGIAFDPVDGGIAKDYCNLSYLFTTSGISALMASFLLMIEYRWGAKSLFNGYGLSSCGQNPMLAYTVTTFFISPILALVGFGGWINSICVGSPFWGIVRGIVYTLLMVIVTSFFTKKKLFWRS